MLKKNNKKFVCKFCGYSTDCEMNFDIHITDPHFTGVSQNRFDIAEPRNKLYYEQLDRMMQGDRSRGTNGK